MFRPIPAILCAAARRALGVTPSAAEGSRGGLSPLPSNPKSAIRNPQWRGPAAGSLARLLSAVLALLCVLSAAPAAEPPDPSVHLFDRGTASDGSVAAEEFAERKGWTAVAEGAAELRIAGDAVLMNDRLTVVLARDGGAAWVYGSAAARFRRRVLVSPVPPITLGAGLRVLKNDPSAVEIEVKSRTGRGDVSCRFRMTAGEPVLQVLPGDEVEQLTWLVPSPAGGCVVVPEFFGDDVVVAAPAGGARAAPVPAENFFLQGTDDASPMLMCVWEAAGQDVDRLRGNLCVIPCAKGKRVWVACLEGVRPWGAGRAIAENEKPAEVLRGFRPPFPAKWRADFVGADGMCDSITFEEPPDAAPVPETWRGQVLIYPIDRSRATPLATLLPIDVLRATLGVGPCQYVLALEGLGSGDAPATPAAVMDWVEKQFDRERDARAADEIRERLAAMVEHVRRTDARIGEYAAFGRQVRAACEAAAGDQEAAATAKVLLAVCDRLDRDLARDRAARTPEEAARLAAAVGGLIGKEGAAAECRKAGEDLGALGRAQDAALARARMAARRARQAARGAKDALAVKIRPMAEQILGAK